MVDNSACKFLAISTKEKLWLDQISEENGNMYLREYAENGVWWKPIRWMPKLGLAYRRLLPSEIPKVEILVDDTLVIADKLISITQVYYDGKLLRVYKDVR